ncbi:MAG: DUF2949 domain-containing protein [Spirulina sp. SIO3F2]|nr:DUF2949 domain-containing protein [Spirulina sp. SIO3F2]
MQRGTTAHLNQFLMNDLSLPQDSIEIAQRHLENNPGSFPMVLWQYGLVTLEQLERIFDWLEQRQVMPSSLTDI